MSHKAKLWLLFVLAVLCAAFFMFQGSGRKLGLRPAEQGKKGACDRINRSSHCFFNYCVSDVDEQPHINTEYYRTGLALHAHPDRYYFPLWIRYIEHHEQKRKFSALHRNDEDVCFPAVSLSFPRRRTESLFPAVNWIGVRHIF